MDQTTEFFNLVQSECTLFTPADLIAKLDKVGFDVIAQFRVRTMYDLIDPVKRQEEGFYENMLELEMALSARSPFRDIAAFTHLVARKR